MTRQTQIQAILELKKRKKALLIAHYYQDADIQDLADYVGDSLGMAQFARSSEAKLVAVCGVRFMAESIKAMNPDKKIILPDLNAGCSLADSCTPELFAHFRAKHPDAIALTYINSSLQVKAMSDIIVTSSNAVKIVKKIPANQKIIFGPDQHLGKFVSREAGRELIFFPGSCFVHQSFSIQELLRLKTQNPDAKVIAHPECDETILMQADFVGSTSQLLEFTQKNDAQKFIVMTESGILHRMKLQSPNKTFIGGPDLDKCACNICPHMKLNTLEKLFTCLENETPEITIDADLAKRAQVPLEKMMSM